MQYLVLYIVSNIDVEMVFSLRIKKNQNTGKLSTFQDPGRSLQFAVIFNNP